MTLPIPESRSAAEAAARRQEELACFERIRTGDENAFEMLFRMYAGPLTAFAYTYVGSQAVAQEIVQELFCRLWERREALETPRNVYAYLFAATRNRAIGQLRNQRVQEAFLARVVRDGDVKEGTRGAPQESELAAEALEDALDRAVAELSERCREVFTLVRDQHLTYAQVAEVLGISPKTVEIHMSRALAALRLKLAPWIRG